MDNNEIMQSIFLSLGLVLCISLFVMTEASRVVPGPTMPWIKRRVIFIFSNMLSQSPSPQKLGELGCGWGGMTIALAKKYPEAIIEGYEISPLPYVISKLRALPYKGRIKIYRKNFLKIDMSQFQGIYCYLIPAIMTDLKSCFEKCKKGTIIISTGFPIPTLVPVSVDTVKCGVKAPIYCYQI